MKLLSLINFAFIPLVLGFADENDEWLKLLNLPKPAVSQKSTVCKLTDKTLTDFVTKNPNNPLVLIIKSSSQQNSCGDSFAESSAQLLSSRNVSVCQLSLTAGQTSLYGTDGSVVVILNGKPYQYNGRRSSAALLSYVLKINTSHVRLITGKLDKIAYDLVAGPKLVGFFMPATPDLAVYESLALKYTPNIPFYLVVDRNVAKHLKLSLVGQINLVKPFEKVAVTCPVNPATAQDIEAFIDGNKGVLLKYVTEQNIFDPELQNPNKTTLIAIGDRSSAVGQYFHKILTRAVRNITRENNVSQTLAANPGSEPVTAQSAVPTVTPAVPLPSIVNLSTIEILWIDPQVFPSIGVYLDQIRTLYGLAAGLEVYLGAVTGNQSVWLDTNLVNRTADKLADNTNLELLKNWITTLIANQTATSVASEATVNAIPSDIVQSFAKEPQSQTVPENSRLVLECQVNNQVGDCLWLKDGHNIGFNLARISPDYKWRANTGSGDCSLIISSAQAERDGGKWVCEVTGDANHPTITSAPAVIAVKSVPKTEL